MAFVLFGDQPRRAFPVRLWRSRGASSHSNGIAPGAEQNVFQAADIASEKTGSGSGVPARCFRRAMPSKQNAGRAGPIRFPDAIPGSGGTPHVPARGSRRLPATLSNGESVIESKRENINDVGQLDGASLRSRTTAS
ncbi:hypothetical protein FHR56_000687 [Xanthomonas sacchari]|uniref:hypothetical protein n=1 Tax=unclassified Xanthomonas TaxID=2643310 RepID=UPI00136B0780|nr:MULTISPECIES: hypothetical protein [unclassified Xanthomonas]MBB6365574.1 hypothetical protein [Xanthomonas sp. F10]